MKFIRNKFVIGLLCIAIGITAGFVLLPKSQETEINMTRVVRLTQNVKAGTRLEREMLEIIAIPAASIPAGAASTPESFLSRYTVTQLFSGDILTSTKVRDTLVDPIAEGAKKGKQLVSVTVPSLSAGVSGILKPGDIVAVMVTNKVSQFNQQFGILAAAEQSNGVIPNENADEENADEEYTDYENPNHDVTGINQTLISSVRNESQTVIPDELRYLEVCKVSSSDGTDALVNAMKDPEQANRLPMTVTFYVTEEQALKLAEVEQNGELHIAFLARGDASDAFIPKTERVLIEEEIPEVTLPQPPVTTTEPSALPISVPILTQQPSEPIITVEQPTPTPFDINNPEVGE